MSGSKGGYEKIMERLDQLDNKIGQLGDKMDAQYKELKADNQRLDAKIDLQYQKLDIELKSYQDQLNNLHERLYDLKHEIREGRRSEIKITKEEREAFDSLLLAGMHCRHNSTTDPDYELFAPEDYRKL